MEYTNVFSQEDLVYLQQLPEVLRAKSDLLNTNVVYFSVPITDSIRDAMRHVGLDLTHVQSVPMRWIKGDTAPHVDVGATAFDNTYLVYLHNSPGSLVIDRTEYPIRENAGYVFHEGLKHETIHTGSEPRLLLGPMNEFGCRVGGPVLMSYYNNQADALGQINVILSTDSYVVYDIGGITSWTIADNSTGTSTGTFQNNTLLNPDGIYNLYPAGGPVVMSYYNNQADALEQINVIFLSRSYVVYDIRGITSWTIADNSTGTSRGTIQFGTQLNYDGMYNLYPSPPSPPSPVPCFLPGTRILTSTGYKRIEEIESGERILTSDGRAVHANVYTFSTKTTTETAPYCIPAGTLGNHSPSRDLHLTGNHAIKDSNGVWQIPKYLAKKNTEIKQHSVGTIITYYHVECPNYMKDNLIAEGVTAESLNTTKKVLWRRTEAGYVRTIPNPLLRSLRAPTR